MTLYHNVVQFNESSCLLESPSKLPLNTAMKSPNTENLHFSRQQLDKKCIYNDLVLAGAVQRSLLPPVSKRINGIEVAGCSASCIEVGGDYFDCLHGPEFPGNTMKVVIGDASGHGINAALLMQSARAFIRTRTMGRQQKPAEVVTAMNRFLSIDVGGTGNFTTFFYLDIDMNTRQLQWVRAGHDPAIVYESACGLFYELIGRGPPLGVDIHHFYEEYQYTKLTPGTVIVLATDGIWESRNMKDEPFGKNRLRGIVQKYANQSAQMIVDTVFKSLRKFCNERVIEDDLTLIVVKVTS